MRLLQFFQEDNGNLSSMRLLMLAWGLSVLATWVFVSVVKKELQPVDPTILGALASFVVGKVGQKYGEKPAPGDPAPPK